MEKNKPKTTGKKVVTAGGGGGAEVPTGKTWDEVYAQLIQPFAEEAVERTNAAQTKKGYNTTGYGYQYIVDRFNEVVGLANWGYTITPLKALEGKFANGKGFFDVTVETTIWLRAEGETAERAMPGTHRAAVYGDALKGAITNALKKTAAMFGNGRAAYAGTIDDDLKGDVKGADKSEAQVTGEMRQGTAGQANVPLPNCGNCGSALRWREYQGKKFLGCTRYPQCKFTMNVAEDGSFIPSKQSRSAQQPQGSAYSQPVEEDIPTIDYSQDPEEQVDLDQLEADMAARQ